MKKIGVYVEPSGRTVALEEHIDSIEYVEIFFPGVEEADWISLKIEGKKIIEVKLVERDQPTTKIRSLLE